ncbi:Hpt domain-containing protein [Marinospirillum sp.]|uniref:Hpt domain-containing protein n=1 Tax=Marinospirillum sp. TaxID=2183934 RepID=UPI00286FCA00|nr:Hpt domain-containing protein [Marinospirillum sp.]MDR9467226.1 Hpt domain-containing protein [Marinospirillum sp.]
MDDEFHQLRQLFALGLADRQRRIKAALEDFDQALSSGQEQEMPMHELYKEIHNLAGAAGGYQFEQLSHQSRSLEQQLRQLQKQDFTSARHEWQQFSKEVEALLLLIQQERQTL